MTDKELLELAAKALLVKTSIKDHNIPWNPLIDDGDALRMAVKLGIDISDAQTKYYDKDSNDPCAATRRAIVRAAAEIGKEMK